MQKRLETAEAMEKTILEIGLDALQQEILRLMRELG